VTRMNTFLAFKANDDACAANLFLGVRHVRRP
jgi:hypothetical protein